MNAYIDDVRYSVLSAPLAQIDRRALSQAWISALHLSNASTARGTTPRALPMRAARSAPASPALRLVPAKKCANATAPQSQARNVATVLAGGDRRCAQSTLARRIVEILLAPRNSARRCTLALGGAKGRVHLLLGGSDRRLHLVALCSPRVRDEVTRALREVRYALAARGILATSDLREFA
ncbi:MAG: hypothetical protein HKL92_06320 [Candidatus Eremiobacteraeota bacterium]|uniref:Uncharacterized protein n=1 Tax=mine drainage metagenome TaxID=410659 RepID=E6PHJ4_9ZZZZ|nr:hypothetical protein [Candidatus Eremiobacteraeota bacterium]